MASPAELTRMKVDLLNAVSGAILKDNGDSDRLRGLVDRVWSFDPEFVFKVALYARRELNVRSTPNLLLAISSTTTTTSSSDTTTAAASLFRKYFRETVRLPSDWLDVASTARLLLSSASDARGASITAEEKKRQGLPSCLRRAMVSKFEDFDVYQLSKYNRESTTKRRLKKSHQNKSEDSPERQEQKKSTVGMKQMVRELHICRPAFPVMCILGKKYPGSQEEFERAGMSGTFQREMAGKRMKLPRAETWESVVSTKGNVASTWEELIEHKKLPFMAMMRNIRNLMFTGVHGRYHKWVMNKLTNEKTVASSKQFPFRFLTAFEAVPKDLADFQAQLDRMNGVAAPAPAGKGKKKREQEDGGGEKKRAPKKRKHLMKPEHFPTAELFGQYRDALDTAVRLSTMHNVKPIRGRTAVVLDSALLQETTEGEAGGKGEARKRPPSMLQRKDSVAGLLALMCRQACEDCDLLVGQDLVPPASLVESSVLKNLPTLISLGSSGGQQLGFPCAYVEGLILNRRRVDNVLYLCCGQDPEQMSLARTLMARYRSEVNPEALFVTVDLSGGCSGGKCSLQEQDSRDVCVTGFSDSVLRFIAERGDVDQLNHVEHIDEAYTLVAPPEPPSQPGILDWGGSASGAASKEEEEQVFSRQSSVKPWRTARVFISSTFLDMHGERDMLVRKVFPELRQRLAKHRVHLEEVDLRWGVVEEDSRSNLKACLTEVQACAPLFIGFLGSRYGFIPDSYGPSLEDGELARWLRDECPGNRSVTEVEMRLGALRGPNTRAFFYFRDPSFIKFVPVAFKPQFEDERGSVADRRMKDLKEDIKDATRNVVTYPANWAGSVDGKLMAGGLEALQRRVLVDVWNMVCETFGIDKTEEAPRQLSVFEEQRGEQERAAECLCRNFVGRRDVLGQLLGLVGLHKKATVAVVRGSSGSGRSALAAEFARRLLLRRGAPVIFHFVGASGASSLSVRGTLQRLCWELRRLIPSSGDDTLELPRDTKALAKEFEKLLEEAAMVSRDGLILVLDGLDQIDAGEPPVSSWLPKKIPSGARLVLTTRDDCESFKILTQMYSRSLKDVSLLPLNLGERREIIVRALAARGKKLEERSTNDQMRGVLRKADSGKPAYLLLSCEELCASAVWAQLTERIKTMSATTSGLIQEVLERLEKDHGAELVSGALGALVCSRGGLFEWELLRVLRRQSTEESLPRWMWSALGVALSVFVRSEPGAPTRLRGWEMTAAIKKRYAGSWEAARGIHGRLALHFLGEADPKHDWSFEGGNQRGLSEVAYHLAMAGMWDQLYRTLISVSFVEKKCLAGMAHDLVSDYSIALSCCGPSQSPVAPSNDSSSSNALRRSGGVSKQFEGQEKIREFAEFVSSNLHIVSSQPHLAVQQALNQPDASAPAASSISMCAQRSWIKWINKPQVRDLCRIVLGTPHSGSGALSVSFSSDGKRLVCGYRDCTARIFDAITAKELGMVTGHSAAVVATAISKDGRFFATGSVDCTAKVWDLKTMELVKKLEGHDERVSSVAFMTADGTKIATGSWDLTVRVWPVHEEGDPLVLRGHAKPVNSVCPSSSGRYLASACWDGDVIVWDTEERKVLKTLPASRSGCSIRSCLFTPSTEQSEMRQLVTCGTGGQAELYDVESGKFVSIVGAHSTQAVNSVAHSGTSFVATASEDGSVGLWDVSLGSLSSTNKPCNSAFTSASVCGRKLVAATGDLELVAWEVGVSSLREIARATSAHSQTINAAEFDPAGERVVTASSDGTLKLWTAANMSLLRTLDKHSGPVNTACWSPDGKRVVSGSDDLSLIMWDARTWEPVATLKGHTAAVRCVSWAPNGKHLVSSARDGTIRVWHVESGKQLHVMKGHQDWVNCVSWSPDSKRVATSSFDFNIKTWKMKTGQAVHTLKGHTAAVEAARFSPDGTVVASCGYDGSVRLWDAGAGAELACLKGHEGRVANVAWLGSRELMTIGAEDGTVMTWKVLQSIEKARLVGHVGPVWKADFSPDGSEVASASEDGTVRVWSWTRAVTGQACPQRHGGAVTCLAFSELGESLVSGSEDGSVKFWETTGVVSREFTPHDGSAVRGVAFCQGALVTCGDEGSVKEWTKGRGIPDLKRVVRVHAKSTRGVATSGTVLASCSWDKTMSFSVGNEEKEISLPDWGDCVAVSADAQIIACGCRDGHVVLACVAGPSRDGSGEVLLETSQGKKVAGVSWSPKGGLLAAASWDGCVYVFEVSASGSTSVRATQKLVLRCNAAVFGVHWAPNGRHLVTVSKDNRLGLWDTSSSSGAPLLQFVTNSTPTSVSISSKAQLIVAGDILGSVYLLKYNRKQTL